LRSRERHSLAGPGFLLSLSILDWSALIGLLSRMPRENFFATAQYDSPVGQVQRFLRRIGKNSGIKPA
jgi:hypothetical protein